jgi:hypothetical protein
MTWGAGVRHPLRRHWLARGDEFTVAGHQDYGEIDANMEKLMITTPRNSALAASVGLVRGASRGGLGLTRRLFIGGQNGAASASNMLALAYPALLLTRPEYTGKQ